MGKNMRVHIRVKLFLLVLSFILFKLNSFSQTKTEAVFEPINPVWQNFKSDASQLNKLNNHIKDYHANHKLYNSDKNYFDENDLTIKLEKSSNSESKNWIKINGPEGGSVRRFYKYFDSLYAITDRELYIYRTDKWVPMKFEGIPCNIITCLYIDTLGTMLVGTDGGLVRSTNRGENWIYPPYGEINGKAISDITKLNNNNILLSTEYGIYIGRSDQSNYTKLKSDITKVLTLTFESENKIWAGTWDGVYKADYPELIWERVNLDSTYYSKILINKNGTIYTSDNFNICKSTDNGNSWQYLSGNYFPDITLEGDSDLVITSNRFIYKANENGVYWTSSATDLFLLTTYISNETELLIGTLGSGAFKYNINENLFVDFNRGLQSATFRAIEILKNGNIFTITDANKFYLSNDKGITWRVIKQGWSRCTKQDSKGNLYVAYGSGLIRSTNYGETWENLNVVEEPFFINAMDISEDCNTICVGYSSGDVYVSTDSGQTFNKIMFRNYSFVEAIKILKNNDILLQRELLYRITRQGDVFDFTKDSTYFALAFVQDKEGYIFMSSFHSGQFGISKSKDGKAWTLITSNKIGAPQFFKLDSLNNLYAVFNDGMVMKTRNKGESWIYLSSNIISANLWSFDMDKEGNAYAGTQDMGLYYNKFNIELDLSDIVDYKLENNYPNPFNSTTNLRIEVPFNSEVNLSIYDILGRKIETIIDESKDQGIYTIIWDASKYSSGVYFAVMKATNHTLVNKMILLK